MLPAEFETANPAIERPQTHVLDRFAARTGVIPFSFMLNLLTIFLAETCSWDKCNELL